jgi:capsular exopolysaccharide synthesis family protein
LLIVCLGLTVAVAVAFSVTQKKSYAATAQVLVSRQNLANALTGTPDPAASTNDFLTILQTQAAIARSPEVAQRVLDAAHLRGSTPHRFLGESTAEPQRDADLLVFHVNSRDPRLAIRLTTIYAEQFVAYRRALDTAALAQAGAQLDAGLRQARADGNDALVSNLESRKQQLETLQALQGANVSVVRRADRAVQVAPRLKRNIMLGVVAGAVLALLLIGLAEALDTRVRRREDIEAILAVTPLAQIAPPPRGLHGGLLMLKTPNAPESESFRLLRLSLEFGALDTKVRSLLITSSIEGEGKTTTVANLAVTMARAGKRVVLIDLDLRRPMIASMFEVRPSPGVTDVILGRSSVDDVLVGVDIGETARVGGEEGAPGGGALWVLPSGPLPPNPGDVVGSAPVGRLLRELEGRCDIVLIDAPPTLPVGDVLALAPLVDAVFVCVRVPQITRPMLEELHHELTGVGAKTLGFVVTGQTSTEEVAYRYGYGTPGDPGLFEPSSNGAFVQQPVSR